jgi:glycosyltransferase involved in cell wall biosynthesis
MQTVIRTYVEILSSMTRVESLATWRPGGSSAGLFLTLAAGFRLTRRRHNADAPALVHVHLSHRGSFIREGAMVIAAKALGCRVFVTVHGSDYVVTSATLPWRPIYRAVLRSSDGIALLDSRALRATLQMVSARPATVIPNPGPVPASWVPATTPGTADPVVVFAGEVTRRKGVDVLLRAWSDVTAQIPRARLIIAGPLVDVSVAGRPNVTALGPVAPEEVRDLLGRARVAALPSTAEGMPMFVLEAMAAGRPVVGTAVGAMREIVPEVGRIVAVGNAGQLAEALKSYLLDGRVADRDGAAGRARYLRFHSRSAAVQQLSRFYGIPVREGDLPAVGDQDIEHFPFQTGHGTGPVRGADW